jgi:hypothetical protein
MSPRASKASFSARPLDPDAWVRSPDARTEAAPAYTARLTVDVTPALRGCIKVTAFQRGMTVADMLRTLLEREFSEQLENGTRGAP